MNIFPVLIWLDTLSHISPKNIRKRSTYLFWGRIMKTILCTVLVSSLLSVSGIASKRTGMMLTQTKRKYCYTPSQPQTALRNLSEVAYTWCYIKDCWSITINYQIVEFTSIFPLVNKPKHLMLVHTSDSLSSKCFSLSLLLAYLSQQSQWFFWIHASSSFLTWAHPLLTIHHQDFLHTLMKLLLA